MNTGRRLLSGASWTYGAQLLTVVAQFAYAAITSRAVGADGFGAYAIALTVTGLINLIASGGLGQSVARMLEIDQVRLRSLVTYAMVLGGAAAVFLFATAHPWALLWGAPEATAPLQWLSIGALLAPLSGLATGLARRLGKFRSLAIATVVSNVLGMVVGSIAVVTFRTAESLVVSALVANVLITLIAIIITERRLLGVSSLRNARADVAFTWRLTVANLMAYLVGNITKFSSSRFIGPGALGQWNRAEVISSIPFQQVQGALLQAVYPEFRHDIESPSRARIVWTDMLTLVAWIAIPCAAVAAAIVPHIVPVLFGPGWEVAASITPILCLLGGVQILTTLLAGGIEALALFRWVWITYGVLLVVQAIAAVGVFVFRDLYIAVWASVVVAIVHHGVSLTAAHINGYVELRTLLREYLGVAAVSALCLVATWGATELIGLATGEPVWWLAFTGLLLVIAVAAWFVRTSYPPLRLARKYGIL